MSKSKPTAGGKITVKDAEGNVIRVDDPEPADPDQEPGADQRERHGSADVVLGRRDPEWRNNNDPGWDNAVRLLEDGAE